MNLSSFKENLATYGADLTRWPQDLKTDAEKFLAQSDDARREQAAMQKVDALFKGNDSAPPAGLAERIIKKSQEDK